MCSDTNKNIHQCFDGKTITVTITVIIIIITNNNNDNIQPVGLFKLKVLNSEYCSSTRAGGDEKITEGKSEPTT